MRPREGQVFRQIERDLSAQDPALAAYLSGRSRYRRPARATALVYLVPPALLVAGLLSRQPPLLVAGIVLAPLVSLVAFRVVRPRSSLRRQSRQD